MNDYKELINTLNFCLSSVSVNGDCDKCAYNCGNTSCVSSLVREAADAIEQLVKECNELTTKCCRLEQERDAAVAAVHKQCSTCKRVDFCATDAGQPTLWACVSAAKCNWEWRGVQEDNDAKID